MQLIKPLLLLCLLTSPVFAADVEQNMVNNIAAANKRLDKTQNQISAERVKLAQQLRKLEQQVLALRNETAVARRKMDERTLGLAQLEERLGQWQQQQDFQQNLVNRFLQQQGQNFSQLQAQTLPEKVTQATAIATQFRVGQQPNWQKQDVVLPGGKVRNADVLTIGPVTWFVDKQSEIAGLAQFSEGMLRATATLESDLLTQLTQSQTANTALLTLDPTLGRASTKQQASESPAEHVIKGGIWVVPILLFALAALIIAIIKVVQLLKLPKVTVVASGMSLHKLLAEKGQNAFSGMQSALHKVANKAANQADRDDELFSLLQQQKHQLDKWNNTIAITAAVAPLLGLLGTVSGMIETFKMMTAFGSSDPEVVSGGIAKALVTTELGLVVAIPALILHAILSRKARGYYEQLENFAVLLSNQPVGKASNDDDAAVNKQAKA